MTHRLIVPFGPAHDLPHADRPSLRHFFVALGSIFVYRLPSRQQQTVGKVGILGEGVLIPAANFIERALANTRHRPSVLRHQVQIHARLLIDLVATRALQIEQARQTFLSDIQGHNPAHDGSNLGVEERGHQLAEQRLAGDVIGVENEHDFSVDESHGILQGSGFARLPADAVKGLDVGMLFCESVDDLPRPVGRAVIDRDDVEPFCRVIHFQKRLQDVGDHGLLVVGSDQNRDRRPVGALNDPHRDDVASAEKAVKRKVIMASGIDADK